MKKRILQLVGVLLMAVSLYSFLSIVSYDAGDPSLNNAGSAAVSNWMGGSGAVLADLLLQGLGLATLLLITCGLVWGWRLLKQGALRIFGLKLLGLLLGAASVSTFLSSLGAPKFWPIVSGLGGALGLISYEALLTILPAFLAGTAGFLLSVATVPLALGLSKEEWVRVYNIIKSPLPYVMAGVGNARDLAADGIVPRLQARFSKEAEQQSSAMKPEVVPKPPTPEPQLEVKDAAGVKEESKISRSARSEAKKQASLELRVKQGDYEAPPLSILKDNKNKGKKKELSDSALKQNAKLLSKVLEDFNIKGTITNIRPGPVVTLYELEPAAGTKSSRVVGLSDDIARSMSAISARIAVIPGRNAIGIELPNHTRDTVFLRELLEDDEYIKTDMGLPLALGKDIGGDPIIADLARMPHLLVAGTTGSGKSVAVNTMLLSLMYHHGPEQCKFILIDPKMLELSVYDGVPHLLTPVVTEPGKAVVALKWTVKEMENRYRLMATLGVRNIDGYNKRIREAKKSGEVITREVQTGFDPETGKPTYEKQQIDMEALPYIVVVVDEMADLMLVSGKEIEGSIQRLAQMARAAGIHLIMATQRPSVDVITGVIKANFPTRISFQVTSKIDSRTVLGEQGAEQLLGMGDMLYMAGGGRITRVHGPFASDGEVEKVVQHLKKQGTPTYIEAVTQSDEDELGEFFDEDESDEDRLLYDKAVAIVARDRKASTSYIQRCLKIGYNRAARIIEKMERDGMVSPANHVGKREVLLREEDA